MEKFRALSTVQTFAVKSMSSPVEKWMTKGSASSLPPLHNPSGVESGAAAQKSANNSQQWRHNDTHWTHSQAGSSGLCNLKGEESNQEQTHPWKSQGCEGDLCAFLCAAGMSWWPRAGVVLLWPLCVCVWNLPNILLALGFQGILSLFCLWNPAEVTAGGTSQLWAMRAALCPNPWQNKFAFRTTQGWFGQHSVDILALLWWGLVCLLAFALFVDGFPPALCLHA